MERNADKQTDITKDTGKGKTTKKWSPCTDDFAPECPKKGWVQEQIDDVTREFCKGFARGVLLGKRDFPAS